MDDHRTKRDRKFDDSVDRNQAQQRVRAESIVRPLTVTQVGQDGFFYLEAGQTIPTFHPWPRSSEATEGSKFGRVTPRKGQA